MEVTLLPDLVLTEITWDPALPVPGDHVIFSATIRNQGFGPTPAGVKHGVAFAIGGRSVTWSDTHYTSLGAGESVTLTANGGPGRTDYWICGQNPAYIIRAEVNDTNDFPETDRENNVLTAELVPDLSGGTGWDSILAGGSVRTQPGALVVTGVSAGTPVAVYSLMGQTVATTVAAGEALVLPVPAGAYIVRVWEDGHSRVVKTIVPSL
jgi:hypothetical protein